MVRSLIHAIIAALLIVSARAELQLTPSVVQYELDGVKLKQLAFSDGAEQVTYQAPRGWEYSGSATQLTLRPPNKPQAEATITRIALPQPGSFDDESLKKLVTEAVASLPKDSENVTVVSQEMNPLLINRKETFLITLAYDFYGASYSRSTLFLNRGNEQIRFQLVCHQADFKELQKAFLGSQYSWRNL
jgi:hypothetical protein